MRSTAIALITSSQTLCAIGDLGRLDPTCITGQDGNLLLRVSNGTGKAWQDHLVGLRKSLTPHMMLAVDVEKCFALGGNVGEGHKQQLFRPGGWLIGFRVTTRPAYIQPHGV